MFRKRQILLAILFAVGSFGATLAWGQSTSAVQGVANVGSPVPAKPLAMGGSDGTNVRYVAVDSLGQMSIKGGIADGASSSTTNPFLVAGVSSASNNTIRPLKVESSSNALLVSLGINNLLDIPTKSGKLTSNGTTKVQIRAGSAGTNVYLVKLWASNQSTTVTHYLTVRESSGVEWLSSIPLGANSASSGGGVLALDSDHGSYIASSGNDLEFLIDSGGTGTDVLVNAFTVRK